MDRALEGVELTAVQRTTINTALENERRAARNAATEEAKVQFRAGVAGSRKPTVFDSTQTNIQTYMDAFEPFRAVMCLEGGAAINTFMTYLNSVDQRTITEHDLIDINDWEQFKLRVVEVLSPSKARIQARFELKKATQKADETVEKFGQRMSDFARIGFAADQDREKDAALKDTLIGGVLKDEIAVQLINSAHKNYTELLTEATELDASYRARQALRDGDKYSVTVMKNQSNEPLAPVMGKIGVPDRVFQSNAIQTHRYDAEPHEAGPSKGVSCFSCGQFGHVSTYCPNTWGLPSSQMYQYPRDSNYNRDRVQQFDRNSRGSGNGGRAPFSCFNCGKPGHYARDCRSRIQYDNNQQGYRSGVGQNRGNYGYRRGSNGGSRYNRGQEGSGMIFTPHPGNYTGNYPLPDRAQQAYNIAVDRQLARSQTANNPSCGLGFEEYRTPQMQDNTKKLPSDSLQPSENTVTKN